MSEGRMITKIARDVSRYTLSYMKADNIGSGELDLIHLVRHHPGVTQSEICTMLNMDKGAAARRTARLEEKGYLIRKEHPTDKRSKCLYPTQKAQNLRNTKENIENSFYDWLFEPFSQEEKTAFFEMLEKLYHRAKDERRCSFKNIQKEEAKWKSSEE